MSPGRPPASDVAPQNVRVAGALVAAQGAVAVVFAVVLAVRSLGSAGRATGPGTAEAVFFLLIGAAVVAIVIQLLLLPVVYSLLGPSKQLLLGIVSGAVVILTFLLLISDQSRRWSMGEDYPEEG